MIRNGCLFLIIAMLFCLSCCTSMDKSINFAVCGSYGVPGMMCFDLKGDSFSCKIIETDSYNRTLFAYEAFNHIENVLKTYLVICQQATSKNVLFYEDICYISYTEETELISELKNNNDWEKPLNQSKMAERPISVSNDLVLQINTKTDLYTIRDKFRKLQGLSNENVLDSVVIDVNEDGQLLTVIWLAEKNGTQKYLVMCDTDYLIQWTPINDGSSFEKQVVDFKHSNNWTYNVA